VAAGPIITLAFLSFIGLGVPKAAFGTAWPSVAGDLDRGIAELGIVLIVYIAGYFISSALNGAMIRRIGLGRTLVLSSALASAALAGYAAAGAWTALLAAALVLGISGGMVDAGINAYVALRHTTRVMGFLHASFGIGATLGPLLMTVVLGLDIEWRWGYVIMFVAQLALTAGFWFTRSRWDVAAPHRIAPPIPTGGRRRGTLLSLLLFFLYAGTEIGAGQWAFSLLVEGRGYGDTPAGLLVTAYWGALTVGRLGLGIAGDRFGHPSILRIAVVAAAVGLGAFWWDPVPGVAAAGLVLTGLALAPIFPLLMTGTPARLGSDFAPWAVGYQLAAATAGAAAVPGGLGALVAWTDLEIIGPTLLATAVGMVVVAWAGGFTRRIRPAPTSHTG